MLSTRQGGLTSPMLFNVFYQKLVHLLSTRYSGITINNETYNVFCYADDIILASLSKAGLQQLIDTVSSFIKAGGLNFNPSKNGLHHIWQAPFEDCSEVDTQWHNPHRRKASQMLGKHPIKQSC